MNLFKNKPLIVTVVILIILIALMVFTSGSNTISRNTTIAGSAFVPLQEFFYRVSDSIVGAFAGSEQATQVENEALKSQMDGYKSSMMNYDELLMENKRLLAMLDYKQNNQTKELKVAKITGKEPSNWFDVFTINLGAKDGIKENMPVVTPDGLVGRVEEVGLNWSKVMGIIDGRSGVSAIMERTRNVGVAKGAIGVDALSATLSMNYLPIDTDVVEGDVVLTSGLDGVYPKGLVIGSVTGTTNATGGKNVTIKPSADFRRLEEVMVVISTADTAAVVEDNIADNAVPAPLPTGSALPVESALPLDATGDGQETPADGQG